MLPTVPVGVDQAAQPEAEIFIFAHNHRLSTSRRFEDNMVLCVTKTQVSNRLRFNLEVLSNPPGKCRWELCIDPDDHAATTG